jgi:hypothetical protein
MARIKRSGQGGPKRSGRRGRKKTEVGRGYVVLMGLLLLLIAALLLPAHLWLAALCCFAAD